MALPQALQGISAIAAMIGLPVTIASLYNSYGRIPVLIQKSKQLAELLDKLPDTAEGRAQIEDELRFRLNSLAFLYEFPNITGLRPQAYFMAAFTAAGLAGTWLDIHYGRTTVFQWMVFGVIAITAYLAMTEYFNGQGYIDVARDVFRYLKCETGVYDPKPNIFVVRSQPTLEQIHERMHEYYDAYPQVKFDKVELLNKCWKEIEQHFDNKARWYEKFSVTYLFVSAYRLGKRGITNALNKKENKPQDSKAPAGTSEDIDDWSV